MSKIRIDPQDWVVVCDGSKWLILENKGDAEYVNLVVREDRKDDNPPTHAQGSERPGRAHQSVGAGRSAVGQTDWHDQAEQHFLKALAARLLEADAADTVLVDAVRGNLHRHAAAAVVTHAAEKFGQLDRSRSRVFRRLGGFAVINEDGP